MSTQQQTIQTQKEKFSPIVIFVTIIYIVFIASTVSAVNDFDQYKSYLHEPSVGDRPELKVFGEFSSQLFPGAGTYSYVIESPPGVTGLGP